MLLATLTTQETYRATSGSGITASSRIQHNGSTGKSGTIGRAQELAQECDRGSWMVGAEGDSTVWKGGVGLCCCLNYYSINSIVSRKGICC